MRKIVVLVVLMFLSFGFVKSEPTMTERSISLKLDIPWIDFSYTRRWTGNDAAKFCPPDAPFDCQYTVTIGGLTSGNVPPTD